GEEEVTVIAVREGEALAEPVTSSRPDHGSAGASPSRPSFFVRQRARAFLDVSGGFSRQEMERFRSGTGASISGNGTLRSENERVSTSREAFRSGSEAFRDMSGRVMTSPEVFPTCRQAFHFLS